jgi:predicted acyltransferase
MNVVEPMQKPSQPAVAVAPARLTSLDAYRGFVMLLMASEGLGITQVARTLKESGFWQFMSYQTDHVAWRGCSLWDLIQPSFMFMVGVAMPYSLASRQAKGQPASQMFLHALWRALMLVFLGIFLRSVGKEQTYFTFEDVLTQIGLGYPLLFLLAWTKPRVQLVSAVSILFFYWLAFALFPLPGPDFDYQKVGVPADWPHLQGFAAHWDKNTNFAAAFDQWFLNVFPRAKPFVFNGGGYLTLSFVPSLGTMIFGLLAGGLLRSSRPPTGKFWALVAAGVGGLALGWLLDATGVCPSVKRIWTPSWALFSTGWTCLLLAGFYGAIDLKGYSGWSFPLLVVGMNSIAMYCMAHLFDRFIRDSLRIHLGRHVFDLFGTVYAPILERSAMLFVLWLLCFWLYKRRIFLRI